MNFCVVVYQNKRSRAKGTHKPGSDIDLTAQAKVLSHAECMQIEEELDELLLPHQIDFSWYDQIDNKQLLEHINRCGIIFYSKV